MCRSKTRFAGHGRTNRGVESFGRPGNTLVVVFGCLLVIESGEYRMDSFGRMTTWFDSDHHLGMGTPTSKINLLVRETW